VVQGFDVRDWNECDITPKRRLPGEGAERSSGERVLGHFGGVFQGKQGDLHMKIGGIQFPEPLLAALRGHNLVIFAGAGVSMADPANLPSFRRLAQLISAGTGETMEEGEPEDRFLGRLQHRQVDVHARAAQELTQGDPRPTDLHRNLLRLYSTAVQVRIVTTNFDLLFEQSARDEFGVVPEVFQAPALPLGQSFNGIVHLHGAISSPEEMVLTDADFGRAYLTEGWARRFLVDLFQHSTVLFVGYRHEDTIVSYLARALPVSGASRRFALTGEDDNPQRWRVLGVEPICYAKPHECDHSRLYEGIRRLADIVRRSVLDWQREVTELAMKPPPLGEEEADTIDYALKDPTKARFFAAAARSSEWIGWLDKRKHLDALFTDHDLSERDIILAGWLAERYAARSADDLFLLIAEHDMRLNPHFWWRLGHKISRGREEPLDNETLSRWVSVLLATSPAETDHYVLFELGKRCIEQGALESLLDVLDAMAASRLRLKQGIPWLNDNEDSSNIAIEVELPLIGKYETLIELWEKGLKPNLARVAEPLLSLVLRRLEEQHSRLRAWQKASRDWDSICRGRSAIEPHEQNRYPDAVDALIDVARDCLEWLGSNRVQVAAWWCDCLACSEAPLLRRLAVHALCAREDLAADAKLNWLLANVGLHDTSAHHEIFRAVRLAYPKASPEGRKAIIKSVLAYRWPDEEDTDKVRRTAYHHFNWLHWLHDAAPHCTLTKEALNDVWEQYPEFKPREYPVKHWSELGHDGPRSPWTAEELLRRPPAEWLPELLSFEPQVPGPDRDGLVALKTAAKQNLDWGLGLARALAEKEEWDTDLWSGLIHAWAEMGLDEVGYRKVLKWLGRVELYPKHARVIADALFALVKDGGRPYVLDLLSEVNRIAVSLWRRLDRSEQSEEAGNYPDLAINRPAGVLAEFWLASLSLWRGNQSPVPQALSEQYRCALSEIVQDHTFPGRLGRAVLAMQFDFLLAADEEWTRENLLPLFDPDTGGEDFRAVWEGFLWSRLSPAVAELLAPAFLKAVERIESDLAYCREQFMEYYTVMVGYYVHNPLDTWIPELFRHGSIEDRHRFASNVEHHLRAMGETGQQEWWQRWLKPYWENRLQGVPAVLERVEVEHMLDWLPYLGPVFAEAVDLAIRMPKIELHRSSLISRLKRGELARRCPEAVARLLIFLAETGSPPYIWYGAREIIDELLQLGLSSELEDGLNELIAKLGL